MFKRILIFMLLAFVAGCTSKGKDYTCLDDAAADKIGVLMGSSQDEFITKKYLNAEVVRIDMSANLIFALKSGSCDVAIFTTIEAMEVLKVNPDLEILEDNFCNKSLSVGFNKDNAELRDVFNIFLAKIKAEGLYDQIIKRWTSGIEDVQMPEIVLPATGNPLKIGTTATCVPFSFDKNGKLSGLDIEIITRFAASLNRPVEFQKMNFGALIPALISNKVDVIINDLMITQERASKVAFSDEYFQSTATALVKKKNKALVQGYRSINDLSEKRIGVFLGSVDDDYATRTYPKAIIMRTQGISNLFLMLKSEKCDAIMLDDIILQSAVKGDPTISLLEENVSEHSTGIAFGINNTDLRDKFNIMLEELRSDGTLDQMHQRWFTNLGPDAPKVEMPEFDLPQTETPLRVGVTGEDIPFSFFQDQEIVGHDVELMRHFSKRLGRPIKFKVIPFGGLIAALSSGTIDAIAVGLTITEERKKNVAFATPHYTTHTVVCVLTKNLAVKPGNSAMTADISTRRICVLRGSAEDAYVTTNFPEAEIIRCDTYTDALTNLTSEKCDATMFSKAGYNSLKKNNPQVVMLDSTMLHENSGMGFSYKQNELKEQFNSFLKEIRKSKLYNQIYERWINDCQNAVIPDIEMPTSGEPIRVGVSGASVPFTFIQDGKHAGLDIELMLRFAKSINRPVEFSTINFSGLISALAGGKVDVITDLSITEERAKSVNFSDPYFLNYGVMLVLEKNLAHGNQVTQEGEKQGFFASVKDSFYNNIIAEKRYILILKGLWQTLLISMFATLLGTIFGVLVCFMRMSKNTLMNAIAKTYTTIMRGIPVLVLLMLLYYAVFAKWDINATIVAIITFALNFAAYVSEMFRTSIEGVDRGQSEAGIAMGFTKVKTFIFIVMPQAIKNVLPVYKGELISLIKMTSVVGYIAVEDLTKASDIIRARTFDAFFPLVMVSIIYFLLAWAFTAILDRMNKKMTSR